MQALLIAGGVALAVVLGILLYVLIRVVIIEMVTMDDDDPEDS